MDPGMATHRTIPPRNDWCWRPNRLPGAQCVARFPLDRNQSKFRQGERYRRWVPQGQTTDSSHRYSTLLLREWRLHRSWLMARCTTRWNISKSWSKPTKRRNARQTKRKNRRRTNKRQRVKIKWNNKTKIKFNFKMKMNRDQKMIVLRQIPILLLII